jgi:hypothetical protein
MKNYKFDKMSTTDELIYLLSHTILLKFYKAICERDLDADEELKALREFNANYKIALSQLSY